MRPRTTGSDAAARRSGGAGTLRRAPARSYRIFPRERDPFTTDEPPRPGCPTPIRCRAAIRRPPDQPARRPTIRSSGLNQPEERRCRPSGNRSPPRIAPATPAADTPGAVGAGRAARAGLGLSLRGRDADDDVAASDDDGPLLGLADADIVRGRRRGDPPDDRRPAPSRLRRRTPPAAANRRRRPPSRGAGSSATCSAAWDRTGPAAESARRDESVPPATSSTWARHRRAPVVEFRFAVTPSTRDRRTASGRDGCKDGAILSQSRVRSVGHDPHGPRATPSGRPRPSPSRASEHLGMRSRTTYTYVALTVILVGAALGLAAWLVSSLNEMHERFARRVARARAWRS